MHFGDLHLILFVKNEMKKIFIDDSISLVDFKILEINQNLKNLYLSWLKNQNIIKYIFSNELNKGNFDNSFIDKSIKRFSSNTTIGYFIYFEEEKKFIGTCKIDKIDHVKKEAMNGIMIGDETFFDKGIGGKVYDILLSYSKNILNFDYNLSDCSELNIPMIKLLKKKNYFLYKILRKTDNFKGNLYDHHYFKLDLSKINAKKLYKSNFI